MWIALTRNTSSMTEAQIRQSSPVRTQQDRAWTEADALKACRQAILDRALIPSAVDIHSFLGTSVRIAPRTYIANVAMDFDAKNAYGTMMPYTADCHFRPGEAGTVTVAPRGS